VAFYSSYRVGKRLICPSFGTPAVAKTAALCHITTESSIFQTKLMALLGPLLAFLVCLGSCGRVTSKPEMTGKQSWLANSLTFNTTEGKASPPPRNNIQSLSGLNRTWPPPRGNSINPPADTHFVDPQFVHLLGWQADRNDLNTQKVCI
jgi:hypothetical protein